jgi:hypothetical protein
MNGFSKGLAMWLWNIAVAVAPYDTGNLRRAITLNNASNDKIKVAYNIYDAVYLHYLEEGMGPVKKHKGFIGDTTVNAFIRELLYYIKTGKQPLITSKPMTSLRVSEHSPMFYERRILNAIGLKWAKTVTADDRMKLSNLRYMSLKETGFQTIRGLRTDTRKLGYATRDNLPIRHAFIDSKDY